MINNSREFINIKWSAGLSVGALTTILLLGCNKAVQVPNPISSITSNQVFSTDATATAAMLGIYSRMSSTASFSNSKTTILLGESADELRDEPIGQEQYDLFLSNQLTALQCSQTVLNDIWAPAYFDIYSCNAIISALESPNDVSNGTRNTLIGEAEFVRAFCYFYLTNIFENIPLDLTPNFNQTVLLHKSSQTQIYLQITNDLLDAQSRLGSDFSLTNGAPIRANKWAAAALLARVYQYEGKWDSAFTEANAVINCGLFQLDSINNVFLANSSESILQLETVNAPPYTTWEGFTFIPHSSFYRPNYWLNPQLLASFDSSDLRRYHWGDSWVDSIKIAGQYYYYPHKYKSAYGSTGNISENYVLLRLAEQFLIRAEAEANLGQSANAIGDINVIRGRAGLNPLGDSLSPVQLLDTIQHEYRVEFFAEWGHRWLDLKRWKNAIQTLSGLSFKHMDSTQLWYPIPMSEIQDDPNLSQNSGY